MLCREHIPKQRPVSRTNFGRDVFFQFLLHWASKRARLNLSEIIEKKRMGSEECLQSRCTELSCLSLQDSPAMEQTSKQEPQILLLNQYRYTSGAPDIDVKRITYTVIYMQNSPTHPLWSPLESPFTRNPHYPRKLIDSCPDHLPKIITADNKY